MTAAARPVRWLAAAVAPACFTFFACFACFACVAPPPAPPAVHEFEEGAHGGERVASYTAAGGAALRIAAATEPVTIERPASHPGTLWIRVACESRDGAPCQLELCGGDATQRCAIAPTGHRERFEWRAVPIGGATPAAAAVDGEAAGPSLELRVTGGGELWLDQFEWGSADVPPAPAASPAVWRDGRLELRAGHDADVADPEWALHLLREQYAAVARLCGGELDGPVVLVALAATQWPRAQTGAFQNGCVIFLRERELHLPWRSFAHEIAHLFEEQCGVTLPRFWSEGFACAVADEVEARLYERGVPRARVRWRQLRSEGDEFHAPGASEPNRAIAWPDAADAPGATAADRRAYEWAGAVVDGLAEVGGAGFFARLERELAARSAGLRAALAAAGDESERVAIAAAPFLAAAGPKGEGVLRDAGIPFEVAPGTAGAVGRRD